MDSSILQFRLFGGCEIHAQGRPLPPPRYRKEWWLLALLALKHDRELSRDTLAAAFWPDSDTDRALLYLRRSLTNPRQALGPEAARLSSPTPRTLRFDLSGAFADVAVFDRAVQRTPSHSPSEEELAQAVSLYQGPLLPDCADEWVLPEREERAQAYLAALEGLAQKATERGDPATAVHWLRRLVSADPRRESACGALMEALAEGGDRAAVTQVYQDLRRLLRQDLNTEPAPETKALYWRLTEQGARPRAAAPSSAPPAPTRRHLPIPLTDLIGRAGEIEEVTGWLLRGRLVTLLGAGGVGKTRLAIAAAESALPQFAAGVWFVDLAALSAPSLVPEAVAKALGIGEEAGRSPEERLAEALSSASLLLVLDNCEHVLDACAAVASHLLSACPGLRVLATSRQALGVLGEQVYAVPSLRLPPEERFGPEADPDHAEKNVSALLEYEAVRLFVERATQTSPAFRLTRRNAQAVAEICHHLDGIPLALELAAVRVRSLSVGEINTRLDHRFRLLTGGARNTLPRQQTLRALIDWSYDLLTENEKTLLRCLSVFAGGWTLSAAQGVGTGGGAAGTVIEDWEVVDLLTGLVDKSLVVYEQQAEGDGERYRFLETVRQYAGDRLQESGEAEAVSARSASWFLGLAEEAEPQLRGPNQARWLGLLETEHDNLRASLSWYEHLKHEQPPVDIVARPRPAEGSLRLAGALGWFWFVRGHFFEGRQWLSRTLGWTDEDIQTFTGTAARAKALNVAGFLAFEQGDYEGAQILLEESVTIRRRLGDPRGIAASLHNLGNVASGRGDHAGARALHEESLTLRRQSEDQQGLAASLGNLGDVASGRGDYTEARALHEESLMIDRKLGNQQGVAYSLNSLGDVASERGDYAGARALYEQSLTSSRQLQNRRGIAHSLKGLSDVACGQGQPGRAARLGGAAACLRESIGSIESPQPLAEQERWDKKMACAREALGEEAFSAAWAAGRAMTLEQATEDALRED